MHFFSIYFYTMVLVPATLKIFHFHLLAAVPTPVVPNIIIISNSFNLSNRYYGEWHRGKQDGVGVLQLNDGTKYSGVFKGGGLESWL